MTIKERVTADWEIEKNTRGFPRSWYAYDTHEHPIVFADSLASGCISTYVQLPKGERLDEERIGILEGCREEFQEAVPFVTDDEGKLRLERYLRMSTLVLIDCGRLRARDWITPKPPKR